MCLLWYARTVIGSFIMYLVNAQGSILIWQRTQTDGASKPRRKLTLLHADIIQQAFWQEHPYVLE